MCMWGQETAVIAWIDEIPVFEGELEVFLIRYRAELIRTTMNTYDLAYGQDFWQQSVGQTTPGHLLIKKAIEALIPFKIQQQLMIETAMMRRWEWNDFLAGYHSYNFRRSQDLANQQVIYGPPTLALEEYYFHYFQHQQHELIRRMHAQNLLAETKNYHILVSEMASTIPVKWKNDGPAGLSFDGKGFHVLLQKQ